MARCFMIVAGAAIGVVSACTEPADCTQVDPPAVVAEVISAQDGADLASGATGLITKPGYQSAFALYQLAGPGHPARLAAYGPPGNYHVQLAHAGYSAWDSTVHVERHPECGVTIPAELTARLAPADGIE